MSLILLKMKVKALNSKIKYKRKQEEIVLNENDFHPCKPFFLNHDILPESVLLIETKGILEVTNYIRETLIDFDFICKVGGEIHIEFFRGSFDNGGKYVRPLNFLLNELSLCFKDRYILYKSEFKSSTDYFFFKKIQKAIPLDDEITKWSFGIVSNGMKNEKVLKLINQIYKFNIPYFEILICGPPPVNIELPKEVKILDDKELYFDIRIPISKKKNKIINNSIYNNLVILHDRITFSNEWYNEIVKYGNYFNQLCFPIYDEETRSLRINDWQTFSFENTNYKASKARVLKYNNWDEHIYVDGGILIIKKHIIKNLNYNSLLNWNEMEDVDLSKRLFLDGSIINFCSNTFFLTETHRHKVKKISFMLKVFYRLFGNILVYKENLFLKRRFNNFLKS